MNLKKDFDEGLGTVYERFRLNYIFDRLINNFEIKNVLEFPTHGMTGVDGINSVHFAKKNIDVTLVDYDENRVLKTRKNWELLRLSNSVKSIYVPKDNFINVDLKNESFDLTWNFAALWFFKDADKIINKMIDLSKKIVFISVNNKWQIGYPVRKYLLDKNFFIENDIYTDWVNIEKIKKIVRNRGLTIIEDSIFDVPPWPDTCLPIAEVKAKLGIKEKPQKNETEWLWSMMAYFAGEDKDLEKISM